MENKPTLSTSAYILLTALCFGGDKGIAFHGDARSDQDLENRIEGLGKYGRHGYARYEEAADELVTAGLAEWQGNRWLNATAAGIDLDAANELVAAGLAEWKGNNWLHVTTAGIELDAEEV